MKWKPFFSSRSKSAGKRADLRTERVVSMKWKPFFSSRSKSAGVPEMLFEKTGLTVSRGSPAWELCECPSKWTGNRPRPPTIRCGSDPSLSVGVCPHHRRWNNHRQQFHRQTRRKSPAPYQSRRVWNLKNYSFEYNVKALIISRHDSLTAFILHRNDYCLRRHRRWLDSAVIWTTLSPEPAEFSSGPWS